MVGTVDDAPLEAWRERELAKARPTDPTAAEIYHYYWETDETSAEIARAFGLATVGEGGIVSLASLKRIVGQYPMLPCSICGQTVFASSRSHRRKIIDDLDRGLRSAPGGRSGNSNGAARACHHAAKYGALSTKQGRVSIRWERRLNGHPLRLVFDWQEFGGPPVVAPGKAGFGTSTIRDLIPYEFGGSVDLAFASTGVRCRLQLPANWLTHSNDALFQTSPTNPGE